ncbi:MAG: hypothetical protein JW881_09680 [Spirochaetales bacterium]|nr:hypothetical protein [Spirochaetales bacterium]
MKQSVLTIVKIALIACIAIVLLILVIPFPVSIPNEVMNPKATGDTEEADVQEIGEIRVGDPGYIAMLFGWVSPTPTPPPIITPVPTKTPVPTCNRPGYLRVLGTFVSPDNIRYYMIKDDRYNYTFNIAIGKPAQGWTLKRIQGNTLILDDKGQEVCVPIR